MWQIHEKTDVNITRSYSQGADSLEGNMGY